MERSKQQLREAALESRRLLADRDVSHASRSIAEQLETAVDWSKVRSLHTYLPIQSQNEIDATIFLHWLWSHHPGVKTFTSVFSKNQLTHRQFTDKTSFKNDAIGIPVPQEEQSDVGQFDVILVPCLMTDVAGNRLGYGGGTYDRFLAEQTAAVTIGLGYSHLNTRELPTEKTDIPLGKTLLA